ncbi:MAG: hypothetical protein ABID09_08340 [Candidatus Omnitrophota bacterium]
MISKIIDGKWIEDKDISGWFEFYKEWYMDNVREMSDKLGDDQLRQNIIEKLFDRAGEILKKQKPVIDQIIELKAQLIEREEKIDHEAALGKANTWVATFFQTIPVIRFDRLDWLASKLASEVESKPISEQNVSTPTIETRQAVNVESLNADDMKADPVRIVAARPKGLVDQKAYMDTAYAISDGMADNGFSILEEDLNYTSQTMDNKRQVILFEMDKTKNAVLKNILDGVRSALNGLPSDGSVVVYPPQIESGLQLREAVEEALQREFPEAIKGNRIIVVPDAYTDLNPENNNYPDYVGRLALGRHINSYYKGDRSAFNDIKWLLKRLDGDPGDIVFEENGKLAFLRSLKITPIEYDVNEGIREWRRCQRAAVTSI